MGAETEIHGERASIALRKDFARPESFYFCPFLLEIIWKVSGVSDKFLDCLENFRIIWKVNILF